MFPNVHKITKLVILVTSNSSEGIGDESSTLSILLNNDIIFVVRAYHLVFLII